MTEGTEHNPMGQPALGASGLMGRVMRSSLLTVGGYGASQALRLASNLILTRLLFPEAFGMMALIYVVLQGVESFSDLGLRPSIQQNKRGDDPEFLNTAWTIQVGRGVILWLAACALAYPAAQFYEAPQLAQLLPVVAFTLVIFGFNPTRLETANRHLLLGRVTLIELAAQVVSLIVAVTLAWLTGSIWSLVVSGVLSALVHLWLAMRFLPGDTNRFRWEPAAAHELIRFGKWIFLSTVAGFALSQGDKLVLGKYISLEALGIYNIGYFLASFPLLLGGMVVRRILIPVYRELPPKESPANFQKLRRLRFVISLGLIALLLPLSLLGPWIIELLYDARYQQAGGILVLVACIQLPAIIVLTYDQAALAAGDSRRFFMLAAARAVLMITGLLIGAEFYGLLGALIGQGCAMVAVYPVVVWLARHQGTWDAIHDGLFATLSLLIALSALWLNREPVLALIALNSP